MAGCVDERQDFLHQRVRAEAGTGFGQAEGEYAVAAEQGAERGTQMQDFCLVETVRLPI